MSFSAQPSVSSVANTWSNVPRPAISPPEHASRPPLVSPTEYGLRTPISGAIPSQSHAWRRSSEVGQALKAKGASARKDGTQTRTSLTSPLSMIGRADVFASEGGVTCEISGLLQKEDAGKHECDLLSGPCESQAGSASEHSTDESTPSPFDRHGNTRVTSSNPRALNGHQQVDGGTGYHRDALSLAKANLPSRAFILKRPPSPTAISDDDFSSCKRRRVHSEGDAETIRADEARPRTYARRRDGPRRRTQNADAQMRYRGKKKWVAQQVRSLLPHRRVYRKWLMSVACLQMEKELAELKSKLEMSEVVNTRLKVELEALRLRSSRGKESNPTRRDEIDLNKR